MLKHNDDPHGWTPILSADGVFYCSPRCGGGTFCRKEWHDDAVAKAEALAARLGDGWEPRVWENLGWYFDAHKGNCRVHAYAEDSFDAWIEGDGHPQFIAKASTPEDAIGFAVQDARTAIARIEESLRSTALTEDK